MLQSMLSIFKTLFDVCWIFLKYLLVALAVIIIPIIIIFLCYLFYYVVIKRKRIKKRTFPIDKKKLRYTKKRSALLRLFVDFPKRLADDLINKNPDDFDFYGVHIFAGEQGSGKTIAMIHKALQLREKYPASRLCSNIDIDFQDNKIIDWTDIMENNNGSLGQIVILDELQNWFNSNESKNFPPEMLTEITQQRKQRKCVLGTSQVFTRLAKPLREQITLLYKPLTILHCLTFVRVYKVSLKDDGTVEKMHLRNVYFFVHDSYLRSCYDTYQKVQRISQKGFLPRSEQIHSFTSSSNNINVNVDSSAK